MTDERSESQRADRADPRFTDIPIPCMHRKHLTSVADMRYLLLAVLLVAMTGCGPDSRFNQLPS